MRVTSCPSPNHDARPVGMEPSLVILHYTGMKTGGAALQRLCDEEAKVSAHYLIEEDGEVFSLVPEERRAWHAGLSSWHGNSDINARAIGIEMVNPGHEFGYRPFPAVQMDSLCTLLGDMTARWRLAADCFWGHSDVAPMRKEDPGELFPWKDLAKLGFGLWPEGLGQEISPGQALKALAKIGYGYLDQDQAAVVRAFQRHFRPHLIDGLLDPETCRIIDALRPKD